jgi:ribonuclease Z
MASPATFEYAGIRIEGFSLAGEESFAVLPELNVGFDVGRAPRDVVLVDHIFLTHGHTDHSAGLAYYFSQRTFIDAAPGSVYLPTALVEPVRRLLRVWAEIDGHEPPGNVIGIEAGTDVPLRRDLLVRPFEVNHSSRRSDRRIVPSLGFTLIEVRQKLRDEFNGLEGPALVELKKKGVEITRRVEMPLVTYCGDTGPGPFLELEHVRTSRVLLLECTFFEPDDIRRARAGGHMHVSDFRQVFPSLDNERILLTHVTRRTSLRTAREILLAQLDTDPGPRVSFLMEHRRKRRPAAENRENPAQPPR